MTIGRLESRARATAVPPDPIETYEGPVSGMQAAAVSSGTPPVRLAALNQLPSTGDVLKLVSHVAAWAAPGITAKATVIVSEATSVMARCRMILLINTRPPSG